MQRLHEEGPGALVQLPQPVNKFPEFVGYVVRRLKENRWSASEPPYLGL